MNGVLIFINTSKSSVCARECSTHPCSSLLLSMEQEAMSAYLTNAFKGFRVDYVLASREGGMGRPEGPPPLVITLLFCFASFIFLRICWSWRLNITRTCGVNRMRKKQFNMRILKCPPLCSFQRRTSLNCKP